MSGGVVPVLEVQNLTKRFGGATVLDKVSFVLHSDEVLGIVGGNGAGKSTLIKLIAGVYRPDGGKLLLHGRPVSLANPLSAIHLGIATVHQELSLCGNLSVAENLQLGSLPHRFAGLVAFELGVSLRKHADFSHLGLDAGGLHRFQHRLVNRGIGQNLPIVAIVLQVVGAGFQDDVHQVVFLGRRLGDEDVALLMEHPRH